MGTAQAKFGLLWKEELKRAHGARYIAGEWDRGGTECVPSSIYTRGWNAVNASKSAAVAPKP